MVNSSYWVLVALPGIKTFFSTACLISLLIFLGGCVSWFFVSIEKHKFGEETSKAYKKKGIFCFKIGSTLSTLFFLICCILPSQKDIAVIYATDYAMSDERVKMIPPKVLALIEKYLSENLESPP